MTQGPAHKVKLPSPSQEVYSSDNYRIPNTNQILEEVGFGNDDRDFLFAAYGTDIVRNAVAFYFGAIENVHRDKMPQPTPEHIQSGLVATMESLRTHRQKDITENIIYGGGNIVELIREKYSNRRPTLGGESNDDTFRLEIILQFAERYNLIKTE